MTQYSFLDDYSEGCHPEILKTMMETYLVQQTAYGEDDYSLQAKSFIRVHLGEPDIPIFFVAGGTLANIIIISSCLKSHEAVISANTGHIAMRETGAIEATGHKIISMPSDNGKLSVTDIEEAIDSNSMFPHMAKPKMVYLSNATEAGTIYSRSELSAISKICRDHGLILMLDGARIGTALTAKDNDLTFKDICELTDVFWIGGTKAGALIGEAIVFPNRALALDISFHIKQRGALLAKGRLLGQQFQALFADDLFFRASHHANRLAQKISDAITSNGYPLAAKTDSNQVFPILPNSIIQSLAESFKFYPWQKIDSINSVIRLVTSWATDENQVDAFINRLKNG
ncbi:MAG: threonine aldolase [Gammaproteobacteria bacterium]|jgi:threonine aldolase